MEKEKEYTFSQHLMGGEPPYIITVKESELTKPQKDLLLGEVIHLFNNLPDELKDKFLNNAFNVIKDNIRDNPSPQIKAIKDEMMKKIESDILKEINGSSAD